MGTASLLAPGAALAGTLDQQQTDASGSGYVIYDSTSVAQSFTAGVSGDLDRVDLNLSRIGNPPSYLSVELRDLSGGAPGNAVLASRNVPASSVPDSPAFMPVNFAPPAPVAVGARYAIVAYSSVPFNPYFTWWRSSSANPYAGGTPFTNATTPPPSGPWTPQATDLAFKTYVVPSAPTPTGQRAAALKKCKKKHSHKKRKRCRKKANLLPV